MKAVTLLCAALALLGTGAVVWQRQTFPELREEAPTAVTPASNKQPDAELENEAAALREEVRDLAKLRNEVTQLRQQQQELSAARAEHQRLVEAKQHGTLARRETPPGFTAREQLQNSGCATPDAAVQTFFWAMRDGHMDVLMQALAPDNRQRRRYERLAAEDPGKRAQFEAESNAEQVRTMASFSDFAVAHREELSEDAVVLHLRSSLTTNTMKFQLQRFGEEWKIMNR